VPFFLFFFIVVFSEQQEDSIGLYVHIEQRLQDSRDVIAVERTLERHSRSLAGPTVDCKMAASADLQ
jgi:hypothetical protein